MADVVQSLLQGVNPSAAGTFYSAPFNTKNFRDFAFVLRMPTTTGLVGDTLDIFLEVSSEQAFTNAYKIRTLTLTSPTGTTNGQFTQVTGNLTLPAATNTATVLRQHWNLNDKNVDQYVRVRYVIVGTATSFTNIFVDMLANRRV
jgi:hypothetical protein